MPDTALQSKLAVLRVKAQLAEDELRRFVDYYSKNGRVAQLGNGEAFQHFDRARRLLESLDR